MVSGGVEPERDRDRHHERRRQQGQWQRDRQPREDQLADRHVVLDGTAEITPRRVNQPVDVLHRQRPVESHRLPQPLRRLPAPLDAHDERRRIARQNANHEEDEQRYE